MLRSLAGVLVATLWLGQVQAAPVTRTQWVPSGPGDLWTFLCPAGGSYAASVDTFSTGLDPRLDVRRADGALVGGGDDDVACSGSACGFQCPTVSGPCAAGGIFSLIVLT